MSPGASEGSRAQGRGAQADSSPALVEVEIRWADAPLAAEPNAWVYRHEVAGEPVLSVARAEKGHLVRVHEVADFWVDKSATAVAIVTQPSVDRQRALEVFEHQVRPGLYQLRGQPALHGAAISTPWGTVVFVGTSGAGKSTLAAMLSRRWPLVCDDYLPLHVATDQVLATGTSAWVRLRDETVVALGEMGPPLNGKTAVARDRATEPGPLARVFVLGAPSERVNITALSRRDAALAIANHLHRLDPLSPELLRLELGFVEAVAARVPVRRLSYPHHFDRLEDAREAIEQDLALP